MLTCGLSRSTVFGGILGHGVLMVVQIRVFGNLMVISRGMRVVVAIGNGLPPDRISGRLALRLSL